jgi:hypothetical protein
MTYSVTLWQISTIIMLGAQNILDISQYLTLSTWQLIFCGILVQVLLQICMKNFENDSKISKSGMVEQ